MLHSQNLHVVNEVMVPHGSVSKCFIRGSRLFP